MSQKNVEIVRRANESFNREGVEALLSYCAPTIEWHTTGRFPDRGVYRGHDGLRQMYGEFEADIEGLRYDIDQLRGSGDWVVVIGWATGRGRIGGVPIELPLCFAARLEHGKYVEVRHFLEQQDALKAVGLAE